MFIQKKSSQLREVTCLSQQIALQLSSRVFEAEMSLHQSEI